MKIVINGAGGVGHALAGILIDEKHDVTLVEISATRASAVQEDLDCQVLIGSGASAADLRRAGVGSAEIFVAATDRDEVNILSCFVARKLGCPLTVARVRDPALTEADPDVPLSELGIDQVINPDQQAAREILRLLETPGATEVIPLVGGAIHVAGMRVGADSPLASLTLAQMGARPEWGACRVVTIRRNDTTIVPAGGDTVEAGDEIFVIGKPADVETVTRRVSHSAQAKLERVMILGGNDIGQNLAAMVQRRARVTLVDMSGAFAADAARRLPKTLVIAGDGQELDLLEREGLAEVDALVAVDDDEELNLITCLLAKRLGGPKTIARVERKNYRPLVKTIGVDATVSARLATVNAILKHIRYGDVKDVARMRSIPAEAIEMQPGPRSKVLDKPLSALRFPHGAMVGAIVRPEGVIVPGGDSRIRAGDRVVIFAHDEAVRKVEKLFS
jgi:trk system potassium uptake protein TrkA